MRQLKAAFASLILISVTPPALASRDPDFLQGVSLYQSRQYKEASEVFNSILNRNPRNPDAMYYFALAQHQRGEMRIAEHVYRKIVNEFPGSEAAQLASAALNQLRAAEHAKVSALPKETWVPFKRLGNQMIVKATSAGRSFDMVFDTGAAECLFSREQIAQLGITPPSGKPDHVGLAVGSKEPVPAWVRPIDLKVGRIERKGFSVMISSRPLEMPLLGQAFYKDFEFTIDGAQQAILFKRRQLDAVRTAGGKAQGATATLSVDASGQYIYRVPCIIDGNMVIVNAKVNGKDCKMLLDTGAETILFTHEQLKQLGIAQLRQARPLALYGAGGKTTGIAGLIDSVSLGPIERRDMVVAATEVANMQHPLLGQSFFEGWKFSIDREKSQLRFTKR